MFMNRSLLDQKLNYNNWKKIDNEKNKEIIDRFLMNIGEFKKLPDISTKFTKKDKK